MFIFDRSYLTPEQHSLSIKSFEASKNPQSCNMRYSNYIISANSRRRVVKCYKEKNLYLNNKFIGKSYCGTFE